jgi:hypothetical protein
MGYRGQVELQEKARAMRAASRTLADIAETLGVSKSSVSVWVREVVFEPKPRQRPTFVSPHPQHLAKLHEIAALNATGLERIGRLGDDAFLAAGVALYAGEGAKTDGAVMFANTDPAMIRFFCAWLRTFFQIDETRLRVRVYLHEHLDLAIAQTHWSTVTGIPLTQFGKAYRAVADPSRRSNKHEYGCAYISYGSSPVHREVMGLVRALLSSEAIPG